MLKNYYLFSLLFVVLLISGCGDKFQDGRALSYDEELIVGECLSKMRARPEISFIDADYRLTWQGYGSKQIFPLSVQISSDGKVRLTGLDPLGRPFFIFVSDDREFTLVDNRKGKVYSGLRTSEFVREYIPSVLSMERLFLLLSGRLPESKPDKISFLTGVGSVYRFRFDLGGGDTLVVDADCSRKKMLQQVLLNDERVEVVYNDFYFAAAERVVPTILEIKSSELPGEIFLELAKVYGYELLNDNFFVLSVPPHFERIEVE